MTLILKIETKEMWEEKAEVKKKEKGKEKAVLAAVEFVSSGEEEGEKLCFEFSFSQIRCRHVLF